MWPRAPATGFLSLLEPPRRFLATHSYVWLLNNTLPYNNSSRNNSAIGIITRGIMTRNNSIIREIITRGIMPCNNSVISAIIARGIMHCNNSVISAIIARGIMHRNNSLVELCTAIIPTHIVPITHARSYYECQHTP